MICDVTLMITFVGGQTSIEPARRLTWACRLPPPGLGPSGVPLAMEELKKARAELWEGVRKIIGELEKNPRVDWVSFHKVEYQTNLTEPVFTTSFIRKLVAGSPGHSSIPSDF